MMKECISYRYRLGDVSFVKPAASAERLTPDESKQLVLSGCPLESAVAIEDRDYL